jgi:Domain of unknown function (DU1801)
MAKTATTPTTPAAYVKTLPPERQEAIQAVRKVVLDNLPEGYEEIVLGGMLMYSVPLSRLPDTYNGHPLAYVALASQKNYMSLYLMSVYGHKPTEQWFRDQFKARGKKLDMGKSCVRFKQVDDLPLDVIGEVVARIPMEKWISAYQQARTPAASRSKQSARGTRGGAARAR